MVDLVDEAAGDGIWKTSDRGRCQLARTEWGPFGVYSQVGPFQTHSRHLNELDSGGSEFIVAHD